MLLLVVTADRLGLIAGDRDKNHSYEWGEMRVVRA